MSERALPPLARVLLVATLASGCGGGTSPSDGYAAPPAGRDDRAPAPAPPPAPIVEPPGASLPASPSPALEIDAEHGALIFRWSAVPDEARSASLYAHDAHDGLERPLPVVPVAGTGTLRLPVSPHRTPWSDLSYRLEACSREGCASSPRHGARRLAAATFPAALRPALARRGERYGEAVAFAADGGLLAIAQPTAARVALRFTGGEDAVRGGTIAVGATDAPGVERAGARRLALAVSGDGDAIAALTDTATPDRDATVALFERLGEGWFESARFAPFERPAFPAPDGGSASRVAIQLSRDGRRLLAARLPVGHDDAGELVLHERDELGRWRAARSLHASEDGRLVAAGASADLRRVFTATARPDSPARLRLHARERGWRADELLALTDLDAGAPLALVADAEGTRFAVGGMRSRRSGPGPAVLSRYRVAGAGERAPTAVVEDSIVLGTPNGAVRTSSLAADADLDTAAFVWRSATDAELASVVRDGRGRWRRALTLSGGAAGTSLGMDASGSRLAIGIAPGGAPPGTLDAGEVLLLR